jgi:hypothetical protein
MEDAGMTGSIIMPWAPDARRSLGVAEKRSVLERFAADVTSKL